MMFFKAFKWFFLRDESQSMIWTQSNITERLQEENTQFDSI